MAVPEPSSQATWDAFFSDFYLRALGSAGTAAEARAQALAAARLSGCPERGELLDVPCGFGRHAVPLAREGFRVVGVDRSETLIAEARRRGEDTDRLTVLRADYRELPFDDGRFDGALNLFSSLGYLGDEEDTMVLAEIARVLRPGAKLVLETQHRDSLVRSFQDTHWQRVGKGRLLLEQRSFDQGSGIAQTTQTLIEGTGERDSRTFSVRVYTATELGAMLRAAGFAETRCLGDLEGGALGLTTRLVLVARR